MEQLLPFLIQPDAFDEMVTGQGGIRDHWHPVLQVLSGLADVELNQRNQRVQDLFAQEGVTYRAFGDDRDHARPWTLDQVPLILPGGEWQGLVEGLAQRARLLDHLLRDIYGPRALFGGGVIPPSLIAGNPYYLRECIGTMQGGAISQYAADLVRDRDGTWRVLADRTEAPTGMGFALGNRRVASRILPEAIRATPIRQLQSFFEYWLEVLRAELPDTDENQSRIVFLTGGVTDETYYEHVYLARELGVPLVEDDDLTIRDDGVFLKLLSGLKPVDVIMRRLNSDLCDPLELRDDKVDGVPGLLAAVRRGHVTVHNAIGAGAVETPALSVYLDRLAWRIDGRGLALPSVDTWWCGDADSRRFVLDHLDELVVAATFSPDRRRGYPSQEPRLLSAKAREALVERITARPGWFVARRPASYSLMPSWSGAGLVPRPVVLRAFLIRDGEDWVAMPGGLARVPEDADPFPGALHKSGVSKDVWVMAQGTQDAIAAVPAQPPLILNRGAIGLPSRVADRFYWLGRYIERIDSDARLLRMTLWRLATGTLDARGQMEVDILVGLLADRGVIDEESVGLLADGRMLQEILTRPTGSRQALAGTLAAIAGNVSGLRERLSTDMWRGLNRLVGDARTALSDSEGAVDAVIAALDTTIGLTATVAGLAAENMVRSGAWRLLDLGRRVDRAAHLAASLAVLLNQPPARATVMLGLALELCDSVMTYRGRYLSIPQPLPVVDLVVADGDNPRGLAFQLARIVEHVDALPPLDPNPARERAQALSLALDEQIEAFRTSAAIGIADAGLRGLVAALARAADGTGEISDLLSRHYFSHTATARAFGPLRLTA